jgi:hypothetical protein
MNMKVLSMAIPMVSVLIMFVWGYIEGTFAHAWLAVFAGGIAEVILKVIEKEQKKKNNQ